MQHIIAFLPLMQPKVSYPLIEKGVFAWYYVITEGKTNQTDKSKTEGGNNMLLGLAITIGVSFAFGGAFCGIVAICKSCG